jgi:tRNA threonylcarbamoyladenosine biosynthesis protein TsaB
MLVLAFDTSVSGFSVALLEDQKILTQSVVTEKGKQSEFLVVEIEKALKSQNIHYQDLDLIAATNGPGSFTGIRIGVTCAKTLKLATNKPLILLSSLEVTAFSCNEKGKLTIAIEAGMEELFIADFLKEDGKLTQTSAAKAVKISELENSLSPDSLLIRKNGGELSADMVGLLALQKFHNGDAEKSQNPIYLREPNISKRKK